MQTDPSLMTVRGSLDALVAPLVNHVLAHGDLIVGFAGPPGCGKTTLVSAVAAEIQCRESTSRPLAVSLDDFYYSRAERDSKGIRFRAAPGSHDLDAATRLLADVRRGESRVDVPRFDHATDDRRQAEIFAGPASVVLLEGLCVGLDTHGYAVIADQLDVLVYLDCPTSLSRERRFAREAAIRRESGGVHGFSAAETEAFWTEVLEPGIAHWIRPIRARADIVVVLDAQGYVAGVEG